MKVKIDNKDKDFPDKTTIMDYLRQNDKHIAGVCKMKEGWLFDQSFNKEEGSAANGYYAVAQPLNK